MNQLTLTADDWLAIERELCQREFAEFVKAAWHIVEPATPLIWSKHLDALCEHYQALVERKIRNLIVNVPPRFSKSLLACVFLPAWVWTFRPEAKFLCSSYAQVLSTRDSLKCRRLIESQWYQQRWRHVFRLMEDQNQKTRFENDKSGHRISTSVGGTATGDGGDFIIVDDPTNTQQASSDTERATANEWWDETMSTRGNDPKTVCRCVVMQRQHELDLTGHILSKGESYEHLMLPMRFEPDRKCKTSVGFEDWRNEDGELLCPERFDEESVQTLERALGPYGSAGQLQQSPAPKGGGLLRREWLRFYTERKPGAGNKVILVDPAGERKPGVKVGTRDKSAMGVFELGKDGNYYLIDGYRDRLNLAERTRILFKWHREHKPIAIGYERYSMQADLVYIRQEMERLDYRFDIIELGGRLAKNDRIERLIPLFAAGKIYLPETLYRTSAETGKSVDLINDFIEQEYLRFPVGMFDDFIDMMSRLCDDDLGPHLYWPDTNESMPINRPSGNWRTR